MATVPYTAAPQERQQAIGLPDLQPNVPAGAFGADIAQAVSGLGKSVESVGNDIYERALWLQNLNNQAAAKEADAKYMIEAGKLHAEFSTLEGDQAVKAYPVYVKKLQDVRQQIRRGLNAPMTQKMYDSDTLTTLSRSVFSFAGKAATAQKQFVNAAIDSKRQANLNFAGQDPEDEGRARQAIQENRVLTRQKGELNGMDEQSITNEEAQGESKILSNRIYELAKVKPFEAQQMLDANKGKLWYTDRQKVEEFVKTQQYSVGARNIAASETSDLYNDSKDKPADRGLEERVRTARQQAETQRPGDLDYALQVEQTTRSLYTRRKQDVRDTELDNQNTVQAAINGDFGGKLPTTIEELRAVDPGVARAWDDLGAGRNATKRASLLKALANNAEGDYPKTEENYREYRRLQGMTTSEDPKVRDEIMQKVVVEMKLPQSWRTAIIKAQQSMIKAGGGDVHVSNAYRQLKDAGLTPSENDKDDVLRYRGALQEALSVAREEKKGAPPTYDELKLIGRRIIGETKDPQKGDYGWLNNSGKIPLYQHQPSSDDLARAKEALQKQGIEMTDKDIQREFFRKAFKNLYGGTTRQGVEIPKNEAGQ